MKKVVSLLVTTLLIGTAAWARPTDPGANLFWTSIPKEDVLIGIDQRTINYEISIGVIQFYEMIGFDGGPKIVSLKEVNCMTKTMAVLKRTSYDKGREVISSFGGSRTLITDGIDREEMDQLCYPSSIPHQGS